MQLPGYDPKGNVSKDPWCATYAYKHQAGTAALGMVSLVIGTVFFLISVGAATWKMWIALGASFTAIGILLTTTGVVWCCCAVRRDRDYVTAIGNHGNVPTPRADVETEGCNSEATYMLNW